MNGQLRKHYVLDFLLSSSKTVVLFGFLSLSPNAFLTCGGRKKWPAKSICSTLKHEFVSLIHYGLATLLPSMVAFKMSFLFPEEGSLEISIKSVEPLLSSST